MPEMKNSSPSKGPAQFGLGKKPPMRSGQGPGADRDDGGTSGGTGFKAQGFSPKRGEDKDIKNGSPMKGPSMGGLIKYIQSRKTSGAGGPGEQSGAMKGGEAGHASEFPTGANPTNAGDDEGDDVPGESALEGKMEHTCEKCGHKNKTAQRERRESANFDSEE